MRDKLAKDAIVMVSADTRQLGGAIIVGVDEKWIYLATAHHVVWNPSKDEFAKLTVSFRNNPDKSYDAISFTSEALPNRYGVDLAILKVEKDNDFDDFVVPAAQRVFDGEAIDEVTFVGRKSRRAVWRTTPSFKVEKTRAVDERYLAVHSFFSLVGFSGGGVFDGEMRLAGIAVAGGIGGTDFNDDEYTIVLRISVIVEILRQLQVPIAPYLREQTFGKLPAKYQQEVPYVMAAMNSFGLLGRDLAFSTAKYTLHGANSYDLLVLVKNDGQWSYWDEKTVQMKIGAIGSIKYLLPLTASDIFACALSNLSDGGNAMTILEGQNLPIAKAADIDMDFSGLNDLTGGISITEYIYSPGKDGCRQYALERGIPAAALERTALAADYHKISSLYKMWGGGSRAILITEVNVETPSGYGVSYSSEGKEIITEVEFDAGISWYDDDGAGEFTVYYELGLEDGEIKRGHIKQKGQSYGHELTVDLTDSRVDQINAIRACFVAAVTEKDFIGVTAVYTERVLSRMTDDETGLLKSKKFLASMKGDLLDVEFGSKLSEVCHASFIEDSIEVNAD